MSSAPDSCTPHLSGGVEAYTTPTAAPWSFERRTIPGETVDDVESQNRFRSSAIAGQRTRPSVVGIAYLPLGRRGDETPSPSIHRT